MKLHHIAISVKNLEESINFYKEILGFKKVEELKKKEWEGELVVMKLKDITLELYGFNDFKNNKDDFTDSKVIGIKHISFEVADADKKYKELKKKGVNPKKPMKGKICKKYFYLKDPNNILLQFLEK